MGCFASQDNRITEQPFTDWLEHGAYDYVPPNEVEENDRHNVIQNIAGNDSEPEDSLEIDDHYRHVLDHTVDWELETVIPNYKLAFALDLEKN